MKTEKQIQTNLILLQASKNNMVKEYQALTEEQKNAKLGLDLFGKINFYAGEIQALTWALDAPSKGGKRILNVHAQ